MSLMARMLQVSGSQATRVVGMGWGTRFPFYYVTEYPKSGGTWLAKMLADYLDVSFPQRSVFPIGCTSVIHNHWKYSPHLNNVVCQIRDGRDMVVSSYFGCLRLLESDQDGSAKKYLKRRFAPFGSQADDLHNLRVYLPKYIESWVNNPTGTRYSWSTHIEQWYGKENVILSRYEELLYDGANVLSAIISKLQKTDVDKDKVQEIIERYSFEKVSGRIPGEENRSSFLRKGIAGDWNNYFTKEAGETFQRYCGSTLIKLGYEENEQWITSLPHE